MLSLSLSLSLSPSIPIVSSHFFSATAGRAPASESANDFSSWTCASVRVGHAPASESESAIRGSLLLVRSRVPSSVPFTSSHLRLLLLADSHHQCEPGSTAAADLAMWKQAEASPDARKVGCTTLL
ncbi:hypothetical protein RHGRI_013101 [Rhododendron griersonianum]|uniref:Secreted protein n=1 Tax=Rhododendron griersonianum TaxID=479676 RepID=A0AAV6K4E9_9ERIC|nr:hypothetical protein RHGRI_013101 [Rhododendron griersonianum]